jgi:hypothetical protein
MSKILYIILIVFLGLITASSIWNFIFWVHMGSEIYKLPSFISWFLVLNATAITGSILLLKYYYDQNYRFAFFTGIIAVITNLVYTTVLYIILTSGELGSYYVLVILLYLCAITLYATSLIFSNTRKRFWLKLAGICGTVIGLVLVSALIGGMYSKNAGTISMLGKITRWSPIAGNLVNVMFIINFLDEVRTTKAENTNVTRQKFLAGIFGLLAIAAAVFTITIGKSLVAESDAHIDWRKFTAVESQQLVGLAGGARTYIDSEGDSLHYLLIKPMDYDKQEKYPLVVCLPYGGYEAGAAESLSTAFNRYTYRAFIFVPYCPEGEGWGGIPGYPSLESLVYETIGALREPGIDIKRRYVTGVSRGGYGTWEFICSRPDMFAAAVPVCGAGDPKLAPKVVNMPLWAFHGANDKNVPVSGSRDMISAIKKAGGHPLYTEYPYGTHQIWESVSETPEVWKWLFTQKQK